VQLVYTLMTIPASGTLYINGTPLGIGGVFSQADINNGLVTYTHNGNAATTDNFVFNVGDGVGGWFGSPVFNINIIGVTQPVELFGPFAKVSGKTIEVTWRTLQEVNNAGFDIQMRRANSSGEFADKGFLSGAGDSQQPLDYAFSIHNATPGRYEIRLLQKDLDGTETYSNTVEATVEASEGILVYPSPARETLFFLVQSSIAQPVGIMIYDAKGKIIEDRLIKMGTGENRVSVDMSGQPVGMYFYQVRGTTFLEVGKVVRVR
jgi:hypothetical protein